MSVSSKVISPLPLGERVRVRGKKDFVVRKDSRKYDISSMKSCNRVDAWMTNQNSNYPK
jgi:hypothetical protein